MTSTGAVAEPTVGPVSLPPADVERRFWAFALDRALAWSLYVAAAWGAWELFWSADELWSGIGLLVGAVLVVSLGSAVLLGTTGTSVGRLATGLRLVSEESGDPVGVGPAALRTLVLGAATLPTFGLGAATLAWTALMDPDERRRGWHDRLAGSVTVDARPRPEPEPDDGEQPRQIVNLTAMRLVPAAAPTPPRTTGAATGERRAPVRTDPGASTPVEQAPVERAPVERAPVEQAPPRAPLTPIPTATPSQRGRHRGGAPAGGSTGQPSGPTYRWRVTFDTGEVVDVEGLVLVGRKPEPRPGEPVRHVVSLRSTDMSLSKTHAQLHLAEGVLVVTDRGSTNGSVLNRRGVARDLAPGRPATLLDGDRVRFGDREMRVERQG